MANNALSNYLADSMSLTSAPTVRRELAVTITTLALLGGAWLIVDNQRFLTIFSFAMGAYIVTRLVLAARTQASATRNPR
ncbi:hypothetical protein [Cryptosporangium arvum]|uniref:hypothetical protein n=1 Tax=Cryptosporangium arvum TaxID=80871 RepID=UPI0004B6858B|nr:hypothetical protein [Cryptosporangium arvum]